MGHVVKIGRYEIVDAEMDKEPLSTVSIPCHTNPGISYQLDGWDHETSVPATIDGEPVNLQIGHYDKQQDHWVLKKTGIKPRTFAAGTIYGGNSQKNSEKIWVKNGTENISVY